MTARRRLLILLALAAALVFAVLRLLVFFSGPLLARGLEAFFERKVKVGTVTLHLLPPSAEIRGLTVAGPGPESPPFFEVTRVVVVPALAQLWERRMALKELRLESPRVRITAFKKGGDDLPPFGRGGRGGGVRLERLVIKGGELVLDHERVPVEADLPDFQGRLDVRRDLSLAGRLTFGPGRLRFGAAPELELASEMALVLAGRRLVLESGRIHAPNIDLEATGEIRLGAPIRGEIALVGPVDLEVLDRHVVRTGLGLEGAARIEATLRLEGAKVEMAGKAVGTEGSIGAITVPRYAGDFTWDGNGLRVTDLQAEALGGRAELEVEVPSAAAARPVRIEGNLEGVDAEGLVAAVFDWGKPGVGAGASGKVALAWPRGRPREITGNLALDLVARPDGRTPLAGRFAWSAVDGEQEVEIADLRTDVLEARLDGRVHLDGRADLRLDAETGDLAAAEGLVLRLRRALGTADAESVGLTGTGVFRGRWTGSLAAPVFEGRFTGHALAWRGVLWGEATAAGEVSPVALEARSLLLRRGESTLFIDGRFETGDYGLRDAMEGRARLSAWPAADLVSAFEWDLPIAAPLTGEATFRGGRSRPEGEATLQAEQGTYQGIVFAAGRVKARWAEGTTEVQEGQATVGGGEVRFHGTASADGIYDGEATANAVGAEALVGDRLPVKVYGRLSGQVLLQGPLLRPRLKGGLRATRLFVGDEGLGAVEARLEADGNGEIQVSGTCRSGRVDLRLDGHFGAAFPYPAELAIAARETSLDPFLRVALPALPTGLGLVASGEVHLEGPLRDPSALRASVEVQSLDVLVPDYPARTKGPVRARIEGGLLTVEDFRLEAEGTDLSLRGKADLVGDGQLDLRVAGAADLRALQAVSKSLRGFGAGRLDLVVSGTRQEPRVEGALRLEGAGVRARGFPHGLEALTGTVRFTERSATLDAVAGTLAGGSLRIDGTLAYAGGRLVSFDLRPRGEGMSLRWPAGLRSLVDADLRFFGDAERRFATGAVDVRQAVYTQRYDVASELLAARAPDEAGDGPSGMSLDIRLRVPGTLRVDNNLANLYARADLQLRGTTSVPVLLGRAEVDRGRVYFQGRTYVISHGSLDFVDPTRMDPLFDVEAETRAQSYRVTLRLNGTLERVTPTLTSDPPLSALQILNLLAGADESTVAALTGARSNEAQLAASGAATLAAGRLSEEVGLERGASKLLGLDRFSIDPSLLRGNGQTPTARVTLGKRITPDLNVIYAQDLSGTGERLIAVEYTLSNRFSVLLSRSDLEGLGFDVRLRRSR